VLDADDDDDDDSLDAFFGADGGESSGGDDRGGGGGGGDGDVIDVDSLMRDDLAGLDLNGSNSGGRPPLPPGRSHSGGGGGGGDGGGGGGSRGLVVGVLPAAVRLLLDLAFAAMAARGAGSGVLCEVLLLPALRLMRWPTADPAVCRGPMAGPHCLLIVYRCTLVC